MNDYLDLLREHPEESGILTDLDGTITEIAETPGEVAVDAENQELLCEIAQKFKICGIVTERSVADARKIVGLDELLYIGNQGLEHWYAGDYAVAVDPQLYRDIFARIKQKVALVLDAEDIQDKGMTLAFHYRRHPEREPVIEDFIRHFAREYNLSCFHGNKVWELRPNTDHSKGSAVREIAQQYALNYVMYSGDDYADYTAFQAVHSLKGMVVIVQHPESPLDLKIMGTEVVKSAQEMKDIFRYLLR